MGALSVGMRLDEAPDNWAAYEAMLMAAPADMPVALSIVTGAWRLEEEHVTPGGALCRLAEARRLAEAGCAQLAGRRAWPLDLEADQGTGIAQAYQALAQAGFRITGDLISGLTRLGMWERAGLAVENAEGELIRIYIGLGHAKRFGGRWCREAIGQPLAFDVAHRDGYQTWATSFHQRAFADGAPQRHAVDAVIPGEFESIAARVNYDRLIVPVRLLDGQPALFMVSQVKPGLVPLTLDIPPDRQAAPDGPSKSGRNPGPAGLPS